MLDIVRNKQKSILIKIVFGLIILSFVIGYTMLTAPNGSDNNGARNNLAARVNGEDISYDAYQAAYSTLYNLYQSIYQGTFNAEVEQKLDLPKQAMLQLVHEALLVQEAEKIGLKVSNQELVDSIAQYEAFQENGAFNRARYMQVLSYQRMTAEQFESAQYRQLLAQKVRDQLQTDVKLDPAEVEEAFHKENDKINLNYVWLTPALVESKVKVTDETLQSFFTQNQEQFRLPEKISLRYLQFEPARYEKEISSFTEEELERYYRRNLDQFEIKEQIKAAHILLRVAENADAATTAKRRKLAEELLKQLKDGKDFAELASIHSDDTGTAASGGELGSFGRGTMVSSFENAAFALRPGQLSEVVQTPFGFHIVKVEEYTEPGVKPLVDAIETVKAGLKVEKARQLAYEKAMDAYNINRKSGDLDAVAKNNDLGIKETGFFGREDAIDGIGRVEAISAAAFTLKEGELARPVQTTEGIFLFTPKERKPSRLPELAAVKAAVEQAFRAEQAQTLAKELADKLLILATQQKSLRKAAAELKLSMEESGEFSRSYGTFVPRVGTSPELAAAAFTLTEAAPVAPAVYTIDNKYLVVSRGESNPADFGTLDISAKQQFEEQLLVSKKEEIISAKLQELRKTAKIEILLPKLASSITDEREKS
jgi:peptidyl-prolyl cis-trans isomerase D